MYFLIKDILPMVKAKGHRRAPLCAPHLLRYLEFPHIWVVGHTSVQTQHL